MKSKTWTVFNLLINRYNLIHVIKSNSLEKVKWYFEIFDEIRKLDDNFRCIEYCENSIDTLKYLFENLEYKSKEKSFREFFKSEHHQLIYHQHYELFISLYKQFNYDCIDDINLVSGLYFHENPFDKYDNFFNHPN